MAKSPQPKPSLTKKQKALLNFIKKYRLLVGKSPSMQQMADALGYKHRNNVICHLQALKKKGYIKIYTRHKKRFLKVVELNKEN